MLIVGEDVGVDVASGKVPDCCVWVWTILAREKPCALSTSRPLAHDVHITFLNSRSLYGESIAILNRIYYC